MGLMVPGECMDTFKTPSIPRWIQDKRHPQYRNIFEYQLGNSNLWGTETLLGDWDGEYLLVAKDFYPTQYIQEGIEAGLPNPYRHKPGIPTNSNLVKTLQHFGRLAPDTQNIDCDFLYVSACFLLRDDGLKRGPLPDEARALSLSAPVLLFTMERMRNLRCVVAMGSSAACAVRISKLDDTIKARGLSFFEVKHPACARCPTLPGSRNGKVCLRTVGTRGALSSQGD
jgi:hypothetical protein